MFAHITVLGMCICLLKICNIPSLAYIFVYLLAVSRDECKWTHEKVVLLQVYGRRWLTLGLFCLYTMTNAYQWIHLSIIFDVLKVYYNESLPGDDQQKASFSFLLSLSSSWIFPTQRCLITVDSANIKYLEFVKECIYSQYNMYCIFKT